MALLNTHATVKKFMHFGAKEDLAEAIVEAINEQNNELATQSQLAHTEAALKSEIALTEANLKSEISEVRSELKLVESRLESNINDVKKDVNWIKTISMATFTILLGTLVTIIIQYIKN